MSEGEDIAKTLCYCSAMSKNRKNVVLAAQGGAIEHRHLTMKTLIPLVGTNRKQKAEAINFEAFRQSLPNFAGRPLATIQWGGDPPDVLCIDASGKNIGVELTEWVNQRQMAASKTLFRVEDSYRTVIRSRQVQPPRNIGIIFIDTKEKKSLKPRDASNFRDELYRFVRWVDEEWQMHLDWDDPQGYMFTSADFKTYPTLVEYLKGLDCFARDRFRPELGAEWLTFRMHGGAYTGRWMTEALLENVQKKIVKYAKPSNASKLLQQSLSEFYLLAYYDQAAVHNTPYGEPGFGFLEIGKLVTDFLVKHDHPFDKVLLYSPIEKPPSIQVWP